jgi:hypothetical protein
LFGSLVAKVTKGENQTGPKTRLISALKIVSRISGVVHGNGIGASEKAS